MSWSVLLGLAAIVFFNRYLFLEPKVALKLPAFVQNMLNYSAPCLLTAICTPIVFYQDGVFRNLPLNPYFMGTLVCIVFALVFKKLLLNLALGLFCFYVFLYFMG